MNCQSEGCCINRKIVLKPFADSDCSSKNNHTCDSKETWWQKWRERVKWLASLHWLPVTPNNIIYNPSPHLQYKALKGQAPSYLKELIVPCYYSTWAALRSQNAGLLVVPRISKSRMEGRAFIYQAPLLWNHLPVSVREADTLSTFKSALQTILFDKAGPATSP